MMHIHSLQLFYRLLTSLVHLEIILNDFLSLVCINKHISSVKALECILDANIFSTNISKYRNVLECILRALERL